MPEEPFLLRAGIRETLARCGVTPTAHIIQHAAPALARRIPPHVRLFLSPELRDAAKVNREWVEEVQELERRALTAFRAALDAAKEEGMMDAGITNSLAGARRQELYDFEEEMRQLEERMSSLVFRLTASEAARLQRVEGNVEKLSAEQARLSEGVLLSLAERVRGERASMLRIMAAVAAATTALLAATFQAQAFDAWYYLGAWGTFAGGIVVMVLVWAHALRASKIAKTELRNYRTRTLEKLIEEGRHTPGDAWVVATAGALAVQLLFAAVAMANSVL